MFEIEADGSLLCFAIKYCGSYVLRAKDGRWQIMKDGAVISDLGHFKIGHIKAISRALEYIEENKE